jgi:hypothetical protein
MVSLSWKTSPARAGLNVSRPRLKFLAVPNWSLRRQMARAPLLAAVDCATTIRRNRRQAFSPFRTSLERARRAEAEAPVPILATITSRCPSRRHPRAAQGAEPQPSHDLARFIPPKMSRGPKGMLPHILARRRFAKTGRRVSQTTPCCPATDKPRPQSPRPGWARPRTARVGPAPNRRRILPARWSGPD